MLSELKAGYSATLEEYLKLNQQFLRINKMISLLRLMVFLVVVFLVYLFASHNLVTASILSLILGAGVFLSLMKYHSKILLEIKIQEAVLRINQNELSALNGNYSVFGDGSEFIDPTHPYSFDLDIFGPGSLFQFLNRTSTKNGADKLASLLKRPYLQPEIIRANQHAVAELSEMKSWRQDFHAIGLVYEDKKSDKEKILNWIQLPPLFGNFLFSFLIVVIPVLTLIMIAFLSFGVINGQSFLLYLLVPLGIAGSFVKKINHRHTQVSKTSEMLTKYGILLSKIESLNVTSPRLVELKQNLSIGNQSASKSLKKLSSIHTALDNRMNIVSWTLFNGLLLWDILQMRRLENWQKLHRNEIAKWFETIGEIDALICFSNFYYNHPDSSFPEILSEENHISAEDLGHPFILRNARVDNPLSIQKGQFLIITGANMAGKSTYLRTVGINLILGMCGGPVCASKFSFKPVEIYSSIRTSDSLQKNESYFYSELKRLKTIINELKNGKELFIILDEILKGTNSKDKHAGSEALLKQLITFNASGIVATHDVALGILQESFPEHILNRCFEVDIDGERLTFDYKLRDGVSKNMNATLLMREMGITV
jgi:DNA mismatch repair ATPase MutS